jgi:hypothetical protein
MLFFANSSPPTQTFTLVVQVNQVKAKFALEQATKAQRGSRDIALLLL